MRRPRLLARLTRYRARVKVALAVRRILVLLMLSLATAPAFAVVPESQRERFREGEVLVKYRDRADSGAARELRSRLGLTSKGTLLDSRHEWLELPAMTGVESALPVLRREAAVEYAEPNFLRFKRAV